MSNGLAMMPWFPRDFIASTRAMRLAERGAYRELLDYQWEMGKLPADEDRLARLLGITLDEFADIWPAIKEKFIGQNGGLINQRLEEHRKKALEGRDKKRRAAEKTNAKRYGKRELSDTHSDSLSDTHTASVSDSLSASPPSPSPSPTTSKKEDKKNPSLQSGEKENGSRQAAPRATRLPEDFALTPERRLVAETEKLSPERTFEKFRDYWVAASGANARKHDWDATWRNWCRREADSTKSTNGAGGARAPRKTRFDEIFGSNDDGEDDRQPTS